jgi:hypothetical protein
MILPISSSQVVRMTVVNHFPTIPFFWSKSCNKPDVVAMSVIPALRRLRLEDLEVKTSLSCIVRPVSKAKQPYNSFLFPLS